MGTSNAESSNTEPFRHDWGSNWLYVDENGVDQRTTDESYPAHSFELNPDGTMTKIDPLVSDDATYPDGSGYSSGDPPAANAEVPTIAHTNELSDSKDEPELGRVYSNRCPLGTACARCVKDKQRCTTKTPCARCSYMKLECKRPAWVELQLKTGCDPCAVGDQWCPTGNPCANCSQKGIACVYSSAAEKRRR